MGTNHRKILRHWWEQTSKQKGNARSKMGNGRIMLLSYDDPNTLIGEWVPFPISHSRKKLRIIPEEICPLGCCGNFF